MTDHDLAAGERLGPYEIGEPLGAGGMGVVYRARDSRLDRSVAIKLITGLDAAQADRRERFQREARSIAQLQHPNVCTLYDVGEQDGRDYLVMELLDGESLQSRLARGPLPLAQVLGIGAAIADALAAAHRRGIVHRDLKPGNVMLTRSGPKLLDFGLAKLRAETLGPAADQATRTAGALTAEGTLVGTLAYMAPEQLEGKPADERADLWALGCVLHEMATGERAFPAATPASTIAAILDREPRPVSEIAPLSPPGFDRLVRACLAKQPDERWSSAGDLARELRWLESGTAASERSTRSRWVRAAAAAAALLVLALLGFLPGRLRRPPSATQDRPAARLVLPISQPGGAPFTSVAAISPDGRRVAVSTNDPQSTVPLVVQSLDAETAQVLDGTGGATFAFWAPDSRSLAFFQGRALKRIELAGGDARTLCAIEDQGRGGAWSPNGTIVFSGGRRGALRRVSAQGGATADVTTLDDSRGEQTHRWPQFLPDGERFLYWASDNEVNARAGIRIGSLAGGAAPVLTERTSNGVHSAGHLLFATYPSGLVAQPFDWRTGELSGAPAPITNKIFGGMGVSLVPLSVSDTRDLVYLATPTTWNTSLGWYDRTGNVTGTLGDLAPWSSARLSADGRRIVVTQTQVEQGPPFRSDLWVFDLASGSRSRLTFSDTGTDAGDAAWSPDGRRIVYVLDEEGRSTLRMRPVSGGADEVLLEDPALDGPSPDWSPDGSTIAFNRFEAARGNYDIRLLDVATRQVRDLLATADDEVSPRYSPDGRFLLFVSNQTGTQQVYLLRLADGEKRQVSLDGGEYPRWTRQGREILFLGGDHRPRAVAVRLGPELEIGPPTVVAGARPFPVTRYFFFEPTADGERILADAPPPESLDSKFRLIVNWPGLLPSGAAD